MAESDVPEAQWPVILDQKCELCDINPIDFKCLNCDELVCDICKKAHLRSKMTKGHKVVCLRSAEIYESNQTTEKCPRHTSEDLLMYCNTCNCPICRECITSGVHLNHPMVKVEKVIEMNEKQLSNIIEKANEKFKKYKDIITTIAQNKIEFSMSIAKKIDMVKSRNKDLKIKLDKIESDNITKLKNIDKKNKKVMTEFEQTLQGEMSELNHLIQQCDRKQRGKTINIEQFVTDVTQKIYKYRTRVPPEIACSPDLITRHVDDQELEDLFGHLETKKIPEINPPIPPNRNNPLVSSTIDMKIVGSFPSKKRYIVTTDNNQAWIWSRGDKGISLVTSDGNVMQHINTDFEVCDVAVSTSSGDLFLTEWRGNKVKKLTRDNTFTDIYTCTVLDDYRTRCITVTDTGNILVGLHKNFNSKIVVMTADGQHIGTIRRGTLDNKVLLFNDPWSISTNINGDIIVVDDCNKEVVVVDKSGRERFIYDGKERKLSKPFNPNTAVTDKHGQIIISDVDNSVLHVLNIDGKFIQYMIQYGCDRLLGIAVDSTGTLWMCDTGNEEIFVMKYMQHHDIQ